MALTLGFGVETEAEIWIISFLSSKIRPLFNSKEPWQIKNAYFFLYSLLLYLFTYVFVSPASPLIFPYVFCSVSVLSYVLCVVFLSYMCTPCCGFILQQGVLFLNVYFPWDCSAIARKFFLAFYRPNGTSFTIRNQNLRKNRISSLIDVG